MKSNLFYDKLKDYKEDENNILNKLIMFFLLVEFFNDLQRIIFRRHFAFCDPIKNKKATMNIVAFKSSSFD